MSSPNHDDLAHLKIPLKNIQSATNNFDEENNVEEADFGNLYEGQLLWSGEQIKICARRWETYVGVAHSLSYIHYYEHRYFSVIHRNIDSETILLNDNWEPKLCEFKLSMKIEASKRHHSFHVDKVWDMKGQGKEVINDDQDNKYLAPMAILHYREEKLEDLVEWNLWKQIDPQSFKVFTEIAYDCLNEERSQCPNINDIVMKLEKALELARVNQPVPTFAISPHYHEPLVTLWKEKDDQQLIKWSYNSKTHWNFRRIMRNGSPNCLKTIMK
nr:protein kinase-like domain, phloem protein 2-like protein [Tanacetum cinerariifolium]